MSFRSHERDKPSNGEGSAVARTGSWQPAEPDAESVEETARKAGFCRSLIYQAINPDPAKRDGLPFLRSLKVGRRRLILTATRRAWLAELEAAQNPDLQEGD